MDKKRQRRNENVSYRSNGKINLDEFVTYDDDYDNVRTYGSMRREVSKSRRVIGKILCILQLLVSVFVMYFLFKLNVLSAKFMVVIGAVLLFIWLLVLLSQGKKKKKMQAAGMVVAMVLSIVMALGLTLLARTYRMLQDITGAVTYDISNYNVAVRADDPARTIADTAGYVYAIDASANRSELADVINDIQKEIGGTLETVEAASALQQAEALMNGSVGAILYDDAFTSTIIEQNPGFENSTRIIKEYSEKTEAYVQSVDADVKNGAFLVFISGGDSEGPVSLTGRSDVNIVAAVNAASHQVLLITIPRDYYVEFPGITAPGSRDKLTHAGIYGMDVLLRTIEELIGQKVNYYVKVNFSSMIEIVDAMGGVTVNVEKDFISHGGIEFHAGVQTLDGDKALHYVRERYAFEDGDFARGRHQVEVIKAMLDKLMSVNTLANYNALADALSHCAATNIPAEDITDLIKFQIDKRPSWHIVSYQLLGDIMMQPCQSASGSYLSVDMPYAESIDNVKILLGQLEKGEVLSEDLQLVDNGQLTYVTEKR